MQMKQLSYKIVFIADPQLKSLVRLTLGAASRTLRQAQLGALLKQVSLLLHGGASIILRSVHEEQNTGRAVISFLAGIKFNFQVKV
jgi:hypothetical protein